MPPADTATLSASRELAALFSAGDEAAILRNPMRAVARGDYRYVDRLADSESDVAYTAERIAAEADLAALRAIDRSSLGPTDRLAYDAFRYRRPRFDIRKFHEQVLGTGALPLAVLEKKIDDWIAAGGR